MYVYVCVCTHACAGRPGRPEGGDAQGMRALFELVKEVVGKGGWLEEDEESEEGEEGGTEEK